MKESPTHVTEWCDALKLNRFHIMLLTLAGLTLVFDGYDREVIAYIMPQIMKEWNLSPIKLGSIASYGFIGLLIGAALFGMIADYIGRKKTLILALIDFSLFSGFAYWAPSFSSFCVLRFLAGLGMGGAMPLTITLVSEYAPSRIRGKAVTAMFGGFTLGWAVAALAAMILIPLFGWRIVLLMGMLPILLIPVLVAYLPESFRFLVNRGRYSDAVKEIRKVEKAAGVAPVNWTEEGLQLPAAQRGGSLKDLFRHNLMIMTIMVWLTYFFNLLINAALATWLPTLLVNAGYSVKRSYSYALVQAIGSSLGALMLGWAMDKFGRKGGLIMAYILGGVAVGLFGMTSNGLTLYVLATATGVFIIGAQTAQHVVTGEIYPTNIRSTGVGWALTVGRLGSVSGPLLGGILQVAGFSFKQYFMVFALPCFLCAFLVLNYRVNVKHEALESVTAKLKV